MAPSGSRTLDRLYADTMSNHPFGIALYHPPSTALLHPGVVGYFDHTGSWNPIVDLADEDALKAKGFTPAQGVEKAPIDNGIAWAPKTSSSTKATKLDLDAGLDPVPGIPVSASAVYSYHIDSDVGAVLLTRAPVTHERYFHSTPFRDWVRANAQVLLSPTWRAEVKENGLWVVISTYSTERCAINMWTTRGKGYKIGFSADVAGVGHVGPGVEWYRGSSNDGWAEYANTGDNRSVVFFDGLKFRFNHIFRVEPTLKLKMPHNGQVRSSPVVKMDLDEDEDETKWELIGKVPDAEDEGKEFEIECESYSEFDSDEDEDGGDETS